ncbi:MAG: carboxypeptidase regulatory-like domain-containing protein [Trueperaceae bacterium]
MRFRVVLLLVALLVLAACTNPEAGAGPKGPVDLAGVIVGVLSDSSGAAMVGQQVELARSGDLGPAALEAQAARMTVTDELGRFAFDVTAPGIYSVITRDDSTGAFSSATVVQRPDGTLVADRLELQALALGAVAGSVAGQGAGVLVYLAGTSFMALTDADGDFVISRVPAGTYQVQANVGAITSLGASVTVAAGGTTSLASAIALAPTISSVTPSGFYSLGSEYVVNPGVLRGLNYQLSGRGFGNERRSSHLLYAGVEVPAHAIVDWSDALIEVDVSALGVWFGGSMTMPPDTSEEAFVFRIETDAGSAVSAMTGPYGVYAVRESYDTTSARVGIEGYLMLSGLARAGVPLLVTTVNGLVVDENGNTKSGGLYSSVDEPSFYLESPSGMPVLVSITADAAPFERAFGEPQMFFDPSLRLDPYVAGQLVTGSVYEFDDVTPMPDDGHFAIAFRGEPASLTPIEIAPDGTFAAALPVPDGFTGGSVLIYYRDVAAQYSSYLPVENP